MKAAIFTTLILLLIAPVLVNAAPPNLQTPSPVIYLVENLDEQDNLGWCFDTQGPGFAETLHTHSCKPQGGDVQFAYNAETQWIYSAEFAGKCATLNQSAASGVSFDLLDCGDSQLQKFVYNAEAMEFMPVADQSLCIAAGANSRPAGPYMARTLELADCAATHVSLKQWIIKE